MPYKDFDPSEWLDQIEDGLDYRRKFGIEDRWGDMEAIYYNVHGSMANDGPNIFLSQGDAMLSMVTMPSARVEVRPLNPESVAKAPLVEALANTLLEDLRVSEEVEHAALHAYLFGRGVIKLGYDSEWGWDPRLDLGGSMRMGLSLSQLNRTGTRQIEYNSTIAPGMPWVRAVDPRDFVVPWGVRDLQSNPWAANRIVRHIDDLRADPKYENTRSLEPQLSMEDFVNSYRQVQRLRSRTSTKRPEYVELWEVHDRRTGKILAVTFDHQKFLRNDDNALQIENRLPFASLAFTPRTRAFWTTPDSYYLLAVQNELSDVAVQRTKQRRLAVLKFIFDGDAISDEELLKLLSPDVGAAARVNSGHDISKVIARLDNNPNQTLALEEDLLRANAREQIGFSRNQMGEYQGGRKTAREVDTVERSAQLRMSRRGLQVARLYEDVVTLMNNVVFKHWTLPRYVRVLGPSQAERWMALNGPALAGRYSYKVEFTDEAAMRTRKMEALQLYGLMSQDPSVDRNALIAELLRQVNDPGFERIFNADVRAQVSGVSGGDGALQSQGPAAANQRAGARQLQQVLGANGQNSPAGAGLMVARRGLGP